MLKLYETTTIEVPVSGETVTLVLAPRTAQQEREIRLARANNAYVQALLSVHRKLPTLAPGEAVSEEQRAQLIETTKEWSQMQFDRETVQDMLDLAGKYAEVLADQIKSWSGVEDQNGAPIRWPEDRAERIALLTNDAIFPDFVLGACGLYDQARARRLGKSEPEPERTSGT